MPRLLAVDLDGTLVFRRAVSAVDAAALRRWRAQGNLLVIATGRSVTLVNSGVSRVLDDGVETGQQVAYDYAVCASGSTLIDGDGQVVEAAAFPTEVLHQVLSPLDKLENCTVVATTVDADYVLQDPDGYCAATDAIAVGHFQPIALEELLASKQVVSLPVHSYDSTQLDRLAAQTEANSGGAVDCPRSNGFFDVVLHGWNKGTGLHRLIADLHESGMRVDEVAAIGDSWNDLPMLKLADAPCAMEGAPADVIAAANGRTSPSVAQFVEELLA